MDAPLCVIKISISWGGAIRKKCFKSLLLGNVMPIKRRLRNVDLTTNMRGVGDMELTLREWRSFPPLGLNPGYSAVLIGSSTPSIFFSFF